MLCICSGIIEEKQVVLQNMAIKKPKNDFANLLKDIPVIHTGYQDSSLEPEETRDISWDSVRHFQCYYRAFFKKRYSVLEYMDPQTLEKLHLQTESHMIGKIFPAMME